MKLDINYQDTLELLRPKRLGNTVEQMKVFDVGFSLSLANLSEEELEEILEKMKRIIKNEEVLDRKFLRKYTRYIPSILSHNEGRELYKLFNHKCIADYKSMIRKKYADKFTYASLSVMTEKDEIIIATVLNLLRLFEEDFKELTRLFNDLEKDDLEGFYNDVYKLKKIREKSDFNKYLRLLNMPRGTYIAKSLEFLFYRDLLKNDMDAFLVSGKLEEFLDE